MNPLTMSKESLDGLVRTLAKEGYRVVGPALRDGAIVYDDLASAADLPIGWTDEQEAATYRLKKRSDDAYFGYNVGPHSWKKYFFPSAIRLMRATRSADGFAVTEEDEKPQRWALIGVRACELKAIAIQDNVFMGGTYVDSHYRARRENAFLVAVNCAQAAKTCFCVSMDAGPKATSGFDLALTEIIDQGNHTFLVTIGTDRGAEIMKKVESRSASRDEITKEEAIINATAGQMARSMQTDGLKELLYENMEHPRWDSVAGRCLACANCTMVCPTCFCSTVEDVTDVTGDHAERWRKWDSCFTADFSFVAGGNVRPSIKSRYRQWMTHKLATWIDQFGSSGCVGCGRCIAWCPVGIDITEEVAAFRSRQRPAEGSGHGNDR